MRKRQALYHVAEFDELSSKQGKGRAGLVKITLNISSKFYPGFIPIYGYRISGVRIQLPGASALTPDT